EISLALPIFVYLLTVVKQSWVRAALWALFLPYAILDVWRLASVLVLGYGVIYERVYILTDPILYVPWILVLIIVFYGLLVQKLWQTKSETAQ
ncbi:MAG TPA: hypothetical protein PLR65_09300, partial [Anaerolineales bacterium]|nr:hypothetical protein [Anaerolineales bacterium]